MSQEHVMRVAWMASRQEFWVETDAVVRDNNAQCAKLYRLHDRCSVPENSNTTPHVDNASSFYDRVSIFLANA